MVIMKGRVMTGNPKVTIILMAFEERDYLPECLDALLGQSCQDFHVHCIVPPNEYVAGGIRDVYNGWDRRIIVHAAEEMEAPTVVCRILDQTETPYVLFLHSGDLLREVFLETGLALAEKNNADVVICEAGLRHLRSGILRETVHTLQTSRLPEKEVFTLKDIRGDGLNVVRFPSWLSLFRTAFLKAWEIQYPELGLSNDVIIGCCALACAERICAVRQQLAFLHDWSVHSLPTVREAERVYRYLSKHPAPDPAQHCKVHYLLSESAAALRAAQNDQKRYAVLDWLASEAFQSCGLLEIPEGGYYYTQSEKDATFLASALHRYRITRWGITHHPETELCSGHPPEEPIVSVMLPVYNTEPYLERALTSLLNQSLESIEIICYNDGSTDGSLAILERFARKDSRICLFDQENCGLSVTRNRAVARAKGRYLYFMDSDDYLVPEALERAAERAEQDQLEMLFFNAENIYEGEDLAEADRLRSGPILRHLYPEVCSGAEMLASLERNREDVSVAWRYLIRKSFYDRNPVMFVEDILYEDNPFTFTLLLNAERVGYLDRKLYYRSIRTGSITGTTKTFWHSYSLFVCFREMLDIFMTKKTTLTPAQCDAAKSIIWKKISLARSFLMKLTPEERGEEYGLGEDFLEFHSLVGTWCTESERAVSEKRRADENAKKLQKETLVRKQAETDRAARERQMRELESQISHGIAEKEMMAGLLKETEKQTAEGLAEKKNLAKKLEESRRTLEAEKVKLAQVQKRLEQETMQKQEILTSRAYRLGRTLSLPYRILRDLYRKL